MPRASYDPVAFHRFEHAGWQRLSEGYHRHWEALTTQAIAPMLVAADVADGSHILDVACGPGYIAGAAAARGARAVGIDFSANMIALARQNFPDIVFRVADAESLPFDDASFDAVLINFGVLHFPTPETALAETFRVLRPGGRLAFTNWAQSDHSAITIAMNAIAEAGSLDVDLPAGTPLFRFADPDECRAVLSKIGFSTVDCTDLSLSWRLPRRDALMETFRQATARMSGLLQAQDPDALPAIADAMTRGCAPYDHDGVIDLPMPALLTVAQK